MKLSAWWILVAVIVTLAAAVIYYKFIHVPGQTVNISHRKNYDVITMALPNDPTPTVFGPKYWEAYHKITENIPCPACRVKAVPFMQFFHDVVNKNTGKEIVYKDNFNKHLELLSKMEKA